MRPRLTFIIGCTGCGKSSLGIELARRIGGEILSVDSMKVYRRMDVGTAKPALVVRREIPHHLIDIVEPWEEFSVAQYVKSAERSIEEIHARGRPILAVGGTPLYIKALTEGLFEGPGADPAVRLRLKQAAQTSGPAVLHQQLLAVDPDAARRIHPNDERRIVRALEVHEITGRPISGLQTQWDHRSRRYDCVFIGLRRTMEDQSRRTNERVGRMIEEGLVEEVRGLLSEPQPLSTAARQALGYAEIIRYLGGEISLADAVESIKIDTRRFAKAQRTWFKRFADTEWIDLSPASPASELADELINRRGLSWRL